MTKLIDAFPSLVGELSRALRLAGRPEFALQLENAVISQVTFDDDANAGYISVHPQRRLNVIETTVIGLRHGETLEVETTFWTNIDVDNFDRLTGIEILHPNELSEDLRSLRGAKPRV